MPIAGHDVRPGFALWLTGLPASGKSAIARELVKRLHERGVNPAVLESDVLRAQLTPFPRYDEAEREIFYGALTELGVFLCGKGVPVIFDATGNRRAYRDGARARIGRFAEIFVDTPLELCAARDPKGLYRAAREGKSSSLPGAQAAYEPPQAPEFVVHAGVVAPAAAAQDIIAFLERRAWL
jgi:adenylylsulfate kinase